MPSVRIAGARNG